jgi:nitroreductase
MGGNMKEITRTGYFIITVLAYLSIAMVSTVSAADDGIKLPQPSLDSDVSIEKALAARRSLRTYADAAISLQDLSQLLWAAQGITEPEKGFRTAPSGMARYPLTLYVACFNVSGLDQGVYRYIPAGHEIELVTPGDTRNNFTRQAPPAGMDSPPTPADAPKTDASKPKMAGHADPVPGAAAVFVITVDTTKAFGTSGYYLEAGHVAQNIVLQCVPLKMGGVTMAGFGADNLKEVLKLSETGEPIYVIPVGKK